MLDYRAKFVLAPMVRIGDLPTRLLALKYGADLVWGPEIVDKKILLCERKYNEKLRTVDFLTIKGNKKIPGVTDLVFRTNRELEKDKLVFQMGTANPKLAVKAAKMIIDDVDAIDINAGCPKHFSVHSGMGAALLSTPDLLCDILTSLVENVGKPNNKPISVKIRLLSNKSDTITLVSRLVKTGIANLTLHCRTREMRNRESPIRDYVEEIFQICKYNNVTFIINGQIKDYQEYKLLQNQYGSDVGCMTASAAEINPTCFSKNGTLPWHTTVKEYIKFCDEYDNYKANTKYCITRMIPNERNENKIYHLVLKAKTAEEFKDIITNKMDDNGKYIETEKNEDVKNMIDTGKKRKAKEVSDNIPLLEKKMKV